MLNKQSERSKQAPEYIETPAGIFTTGGNWFRTNEKMLKSYAGKLLEIHPLATLIKKSESWIRSTDTIGIVLAMLLLFLLDLWAAVIFTLLLAFLWHHYRPAMISIPLTKIISNIDHDFMVVLIALIPLSYFGMEGFYEKLMAGLIFFIIFKFGWFRNLSDKFAAGTNRIHVNDRILNMVLIRYAIKEDILPPSIEQMERDIVKAMEKSAHQRRNPNK